MGQHRGLSLHPVHDNATSITKSAFEPGSAVESDRYNTPPTSNPLSIPCLPVGRAVFTQPATAMQNQDHLYSTESSNSEMPLTSHLHNTRPIQQQPPSYAPSSHHHHPRTSSGYQASRNSISDPQHVIPSNVQLPSFQHFDGVSQQYPSPSSHRSAHLHSSSSSHFNTAQSGLQSSHSAIPGHSRHHSSSTSLSSPQLGHLQGGNQSSSRRESPSVPSQHGYQSSSLYDSGGEGSSTHVASGGNSLQGSTVSYGNQSSYPYPSQSSSGGGMPMGYSSSYPDPLMNYGTSSSHLPQSQLNIGSSSYGMGSSSNPSSRMPSPYSHAQPSGHRSTGSGSSSSHHSSLYQPDVLPSVGSNTSQHVRSNSFHSPTLPHDTPPPPFRPAPYYPQHGSGSSSLTASPIPSNFPRRTYTHHPQQQQQQHQMGYYPPMPGMMAMGPRPISPPLPPGLVRYDPQVFRRGLMNHFFESKEPAIEFIKEESKQYGFSVLVRTSKPDYVVVICNCGRRLKRLKGERKRNRRFKTAMTGCEWRVVLFRSGTNKWEFRATPKMDHNHSLPVIDAP
ncbi:hypothetical protein DFS34DRAFT_322986 [Phlyctochytrium arcticum]|nr:hypothetical protein DFS34DRAFT_322986 [Phlyctochytrium arcticum]